MSDNDPGSQGWTLLEAMRETAGPDRCAEIAGDLAWLKANPGRSLRNLGSLLNGHRETPAEFAAKQTRKRKQAAYRAKRQSVEGSLRARLAAGELSATGVPYGQHDRVPIDSAFWSGFTLDWSPDRPDISSAGEVNKHDRYVTGGRRFDYIRISPAPPADAAEPKPRLKPGPDPEVYNSIFETLEELYPDGTPTPHHRAAFDEVNKRLAEKGLPPAKLENDNERPNKTFRKAFNDWERAYDRTTDKKKRSIKS